MTTSEMNSTHSPIGRQHIVTWYWCIRLVVSLTAMFGNTLVMVLIIRCRRLRVIPNIFIFGLALADMLVIVVITPSDFACMYWFTNSCDTIKLRLAFDIVLQFSVTSLCALTFDRYMAITQPLKYRDFMTKKRVLVILGISWSFAAILPIAGYVCYMQQKVVADKVLRILNTIFLQILPPILLTIVYVLMVYTAKKHERRERQQHSQVEFNYAVDRQPGRSRDRASVHMMGLVITAFVLCYVLAMFRSLYFYIMNKNIPVTVTYISRILLLTNSTVNFVAYAFLKNDFKQELRRIMKTCGIAH